MKPGHVENCLLFISFSSVCLGGINSAWWKYLMGVAFNVMAYVLYAMCLVWTVSDFVCVMLHSCSGNIHSLFCGYRPPFHTSSLL